MTHVGKAADKRDAIWKHVVPYTAAEERRLSETMTLWDRVQFGSKALRPKYLRATLNHRGDVMPSSHKAKVLHPYGVVAPVEWVPAKKKHVFSGLFKTGTVGLLRLSLGVPNWRKEWLPGLALKLFIDDQAPADVVAVASLNPITRDDERGQFFRSTLRTRVEAPWRGSNGWALYTAAQQTLDKHATKPPGRPRNRPSALVFPTTSVALRTRDGKAVKTAKSPIELRFRPTQDADAQWQAFRGADDHFRRKFESISPGTALYDVEGIHRTRNLSKRVIPLGTLKLTHPFVGGSYGDTQLFFRHNFFDFG